ncbi:N-acetylmuramoyl-L-alanine amidase [Georgenia sp. SYP-B2076]|uniref:N-acetylmuramoyl-L-alanine amidase n=1 Tax=Georgenia sp. SYP-B2076 TaxID=2495881 RepID=UPI000F8D714A|nr:N-acetylmuramoyl-L-alanine amidase [Georgenia sp. SYP-B2076]
MTSRALTRPATLGLALALLVVPASAAQAAAPPTRDTRAAATSDDGAPAVAAAAPPASTTATVEGAVPVTAGLQTLEMARAPRAAIAAPTTERVSVSGRAGDLVVVGVTWAGTEAGAGMTASLRSREGETWSGWTDLEITAATGAEEAAAGMRGGTEPMAVLDADEVEVTLTGAPGTVPSDPRLVIVDPGTSPADAAAPVGAPETSAITSDVPRIRTRADWGADESIRTWAPEKGKVTGVVVHHTAGANGYAPEDVPAIIRGIYTFHAKSRGWGDIGYNVLVDAYGRAWEGRYGGLDKAVIGAHAKSVNRTTFGISVLGDFDAAPVPEAAFRTVAQVTAWKFAVHGISTSGKAKGPKGKAMNRVVGHRSVGETACPGNQLYPRIKTELVDLIDDYQAVIPD